MNVVSLFNCSSWLIVSQTRYPLLTFLSLESSLSISHCKWGFLHYSPARIVCRSGQDLDKFPKFKNSLKNISLSTPFFFGIISTSTVIGDIHKCPNKIENDTKTLALFLSWPCDNTFQMSHWSHPGYGKLMNDDKHNSQKFIKETDHWNDLGYRIHRRALKN